MDPGMFVSGGKVGWGGGACGEVAFMFTPWVPGYGGSV